MRAQPYKSEYKYQWSDCGQQPPTFTAKGKKPFHACEI